MLGDGALEGGDVVLGSNVAKGDADIAQKAWVLGALDRGLGEDLAEMLVVQSQHVTKGEVENFLSRVENGFAGKLGEFVPWAYLKALVAAVNSVADGGAEFLWDASLVLDGEVGNTSARIHSARCGDGVCRAGVDTSRAGAAVVFGWGVGLEIEGGDEFGKEEPCADLAVNLNGRFAVPSESGFASEVAFEHWPGIDVVALDAAEFF